MTRGILERKKTPGVILGLLQKLFFEPLMQLQLRLLQNILLCFLLGIWQVFFAINPLEIPLGVLDGISFWCNPPGSLAGVHQAILAEKVLGGLLRAIIEEILAEIVGAFLKKS